MEGSRLSEPLDRRATRAGDGAGGCGEQWDARSYGAGENPAPQQPLLSLHVHPGDDFSRQLDKYPPKVDWAEQALFGGKKTWTRPLIALFSTNHSQMRPPKGGPQALPRPCCSHPAAVGGQVMGDGARAGTTASSASSKTSIAYFNVRNLGKYGPFHLLCINLDDYLKIQVEILQILIISPHG